MCHIFVFMASVSVSLRKATPRPNWRGAGAFTRNTRPGQAGAVDTADVSGRKMNTIKAAKAKVSSALAEPCHQTTHRHGVPGDAIRERVGSRRLSHRLCAG